MYISKKLLVVLFVIVLLAVAFGATKYRSMAITSSTIDSTTVGSTTPARGTFSPLVVNTGLVGTASGFKHVRVTSCTTPASTGGTCNTTVTWPGTAFADTNYTYGCVQESDGKTAFIAVASGSKSASSILATIQNTQGNAIAGNGTLNCWAFHDAT